MGRNALVEFEMLSESYRPDAGHLGVRTRLRGFGQHVEAHATVMTVAFVITDIAELCQHLLKRSSDGDVDVYF